MLNGQPDTETIMNALTRSSRLSRLTTTAIFGVLALSCAAGSRAAGGGDVPQIHVKFEDLNLSRHQDALALYGRIAAAADKVCHRYLIGRPDLYAQEYLRACVHKAIADAVHKVGRPELLAIYNAKHHRSAPTVDAIAKTR